MERQYVLLTMSSVPSLNTTRASIQLTPLPPDGFSAPQLGETVTRNLDQRQCLLWSAKYGPKAWVRTYCARFEPNAQETLTKISMLLTRLLGEAESSTLLISAPSHETPITDERLPPPWHYLISGISQQNLDKLVAWQVLSTPDITVFIVPFTQPLPNYICTLENFPLPDTPNSSAKVAQIVKSTLHRAPDIGDLLTAEGVDYADAYKAIESFAVTSFRVSISATKKQTLWNVYCMKPPQIALDKFFRWAKAIRRLEFFSEDFGVGVARTGDRQFQCVGCKAVDHPTAFCPFPLIPGWCGPVAPTDNTLSASNNSPPSQPRTQTMPNHRGRGTPRGRGKSQRGARK